MKNEQLQAMGVTPWLGDTRVQNKGGKAAKRTLTDLCREARVMRDECSRALEAVGFARRMMWCDLVRMAWFAGGLSLVNVGVWLWVLLC